VEGIEGPRPLTKKDERDSFDCGQETLNAWFQRNAWRNQQAGVSRTSVLVHSETSKVVGYVSLTVGEVRREFLPKARQRNMPDPIPIFLLGQLAIDQRWQGKGLSEVLLSHAIVTAIEAGKNVGSFALVTHPLNDSVRRLYADRGFIDLPGDPKGAMYIRLTDLALSLSESDRHG